MAVYVDNASIPYRGMRMCHLWADSLPELLAMVDRIGVQRRWLQQPPHASWVHFDVSQSMRQRALAAGAIPTDRYGPVEHVARLAGDTVKLELIARLRARRTGSTPAGMPQPVEVPDAAGGEVVPVLYHGCGPENAERILAAGWAPHSGERGGNMGQTALLYLSTGREDALWFANEKGSDCVLEVRNVPMSHLIVDPEDGTADTLVEELNNRHGLPGKVALTRPLAAGHFGWPSPDVAPQEVASPGRRPGC